MNAQIDGRPSERACCGDVRLIKPSRGLHGQFVAMAKEFRAEGDDRFVDAIKDFESYFVQQEDYPADKELPEGYVPWTAFWLVGCGTTILGRSSLRHRLNPNLEHEGGHIGYAIRPSERGKGYGTCILRFTLEKARDMGLRRVLVTCDADNIASVRIIEKNRGRLENEVVSRRTGKRVLRFWIDLADQ